MVQSRPHVADRRRRDRRLVRSQCAYRARSRGFGLRAGACDRRDRRRRVSDAQQRAASAADRIGTGGGKVGRAGRLEFPLFPPRRSAHRAGPGDRLLGLERDLRDAPRRSGRDAGRCAARRHRSHRPSLHRFRAGRRTRRGSRSPTAPSAEAEVVIAADGIHSELRPYVFASSQPVFSGSVAYRGLVPHERVPDWPTERWQMWLGKGRHFLAFPVRAGKLINYVGFVPTDEEMKESWSAPGDPDVLRRAFTGWDPRIRSVVERSSVTFRWALYDREPLPTWTKRRLSLLGDAAHPMLPHLGQGANQSIEDGMALATILARADRASAPLRCSPTSGFAASASRRSSAARARTGLRYDSAYSDLGVRDAEITAHAAFRKRLYDHDVVPDAQAAAAATDVRRCSA